MYARIVASICNARPVIGGKNAPPVLLAIGLLGCALATAACELPTLEPAAVSEDKLGRYELARVGGVRLPYIESSDSTRLELLSASLTISGAGAQQSSPCTFVVAFREVRPATADRQDQETVGCVATVYVGKVIMFELGAGALKTLRFGMDCGDYGQCASGKIEGRTITINDRRGIEFEFRK